MSLAALPSQVTASAARPVLHDAMLDPAITSALWRGDQLGTAAAPVVPAGFPELDAELPGGGWPGRALTELLLPQPSVAEWRLLGPALRDVVTQGRTVAVVGPPKPPHVPGLRHAGLDPAHLVWVQVEAPAERLWCTEQLVRANAFGALVAWLPQAGPRQIRRLQAGAQGCDGPVFLFRPAAAAHEASAAPLRVHVDFGVDWQLHVRIVKRRGPGRDGVIRLHSVPGGLDAVLTPRLQRPSSLMSLLPETADAVDRAAARQNAAVHAVAR